MKKQVFKGTGTAIVTPFIEDGAIDFEAFKGLIEYQIKNKVEAIIVCGSTGESATLSAKEKMSMFIKAVEFADGRVPIIAGTGSNDTKATIDLTLIAKEHGADAVLLVGPYYNKPTQEGLYHHYRAIAEAVDIPQIIYNVPGRTNKNILPETQLRIAEDCENVIATKEASGDLEQIMEIIRNAPDSFSVYSGDDPLTLPILACGGDGVISVISNYATKDFGDMVRAGLDGKFDKARKLNYKLLDLMQLNFIESNPAPVKCALTHMGMINNTLRQPLLPVTGENSQKIKAALQKAGLVK